LGEYGNFLVVDSKKNAQKLIAEIKGGLSIVMLTMIPSSFEHIEMFKAVVIGVILLSTFIYSGALVITIATNKDKFLHEKSTDH